MEIGSDAAEQELCPEGHHRSRAYKGQVGFNVVEINLRREGTHAGTCVGQALPGEKGGYDGYISQRTSRNPKR